MFDDADNERIVPKINYNDGEIPSYIHFVLYFASQGCNASYLAMTNPTNQGAMDGRSGDMSVSVSPSINTPLSAETSIFEFLL